MTALALLASFSLGGCSNFTKAGRQQHAYEKYVRRSSSTRVKRQKMFHSDKPKMPATPMPTEPEVRSNETGPQSVPPEN